MLWPHCLVLLTQPYPLGELLLLSHVLLSRSHLPARDAALKSLRKNGCIFCTVIVKDMI